MLLFRPEDIASEATQWEDMEKEMMLNVTFHAMPIDQENVVEVGEIVSLRWQNLSQFKLVIKQYLVNLTVAAT